MVRSVIIIALLASLFYLVRHLQPVPETAAPVKVAVSRPEKPPVAAPVEAPGGFNPAVVTPLPDINKGYIFSEKRKVTQDEPGEAGKVAPLDEGPDLLASVLYSGSVIAGDLRRALVVYQEQPREAAPRRAAPGRSPAPSSQGTFQKKQLNQGDRFLGYLVATIEPDRIVFEKGERKVEKFLYDQNKKRMAPSGPSQREVEPAESGGVPLQAMAPPEVLEALMAQPPSRRPSLGASPAGDPGGAGGGAPANRVVRRSQRLMGLDPSIDLPITPVPGLPVPNK